MNRAARFGFAWVVALSTACVVPAQSPAPQPQMTIAELAPNHLTESGQLLSGERAVPYLIHRLPVNAFPRLPGTIAATLQQRGCLIPQTYEAHQPENVVHASLEQAGSSDWAVLCSVQGNVSLLVFFGSAPDKPIVLRTAQEKDCLQAEFASQTYGFDWGIDPASPTRVHDAQSGLSRRPPAPDHDALADGIINQRTRYHFFANGKWTLLEMPVD